MYAIQRGKNEFLSKDGGFCGLMNSRDIHWFPYYLVAEQHKMKLSDRNLSVKEAKDLFEVLCDCISSIAPEVADLVINNQEQLKDEEIAKELKLLKDLHAARGGILEHKERIRELFEENTTLRNRVTILEKEAARLTIGVEDYLRIIKEKDNETH